MLLILKSNDCNFMLRSRNDKQLKLSFIWIDDDRRVMYTLQLSSKIIYLKKFNRKIFAGPASVYITTLICAVIGVACVPRYFSNCIEINFRSRRLHIAVQELGFIIDYLLFFVFSSAGEHYKWRSVCLCLWSENCM